jgi:hypothetical protein
MKLMFLAPVVVSLALAGCGEGFAGISSCTYEQDKHYCTESENENEDIARAECLAHDKGPTFALTPCAADNQVGACRHTIGDAGGQSYIYREIYYQGYAGVDYGSTEVEMLRRTCEDIRKGTFEYRLR